MNKKILFIGILVLVFSFIGCDQVTDTDPESVTLSTRDFNPDDSHYVTSSTRGEISENEESLFNNDITGINGAMLMAVGSINNTDLRIFLRDTLAQLPSNTANTPYTVEFESFDRNFNSEWEIINAIIQYYKKYIIFDFSKCVVADTILNNLNVIADNIYIKGIILPNGITSIGNLAFSECINLTSISLPNSVTSIGNDAFYNCTSLTSINIPDGVISIGNDAFYNCTSLTSIRLPNSVTSIGEFAFYNCQKLNNVIIPNGITDIKERTFSYCIGLTSITISNSVTNIEMFAFSNCRSLTNIIIPNSVTNIGMYAFYNCSSLTSITISNSVNIGHKAFWYTGLPDSLRLL